MRRLGATWWESEIEQSENELGSYKSLSSYIRVGWPAGGGVWVLHTTKSRASNIGAGIIHNASDMEERCRLIGRVGGAYYADPNDCPYLDIS